MIITRTTITTMGTNHDLWRIMYSSSEHIGSYGFKRLQRIEGAYKAYHAIGIF